MSLKSIKNKCISSLSRDEGKVDGSEIATELSEKISKFVRPKSRWTKKNPEEENVDVKKITNGDDIYYVAKKTESGKRDILVGDPRNAHETTVDTTSVVYAVKKGEDIQSITINSNKTLSKGHEYVYEREVFLGDNYLPEELPDNVDITNINEVRYAVRKNDDISHFIDKYIIVSKEDRQAYSLFAIKKHKEEIRAKIIAQKENIKTKLTRTN